MTTKRRVLAIFVLPPLAVLLMIAFSLLESVVTRFGGGPAHFSLNAVSGPGALNDVGQWQNWEAVDGLKPGPLIGVHLVLDLFYIAVYGGLLFALIDAGRVRTTASKVLVAGAALRRRVLGWALLAVLAVDVLEDIGLLVGAFRIDDGLMPPELAIAIAVVTLVKWCSLGLLIVLIVGHLAVTVAQRRRPRVRAE
jgi:hypothetical protein